jgi:hypothetical protein
LLIFFKGNGPKWSIWPSAAPFAPFLLQWYFDWNVNDSYKNDTNQVSGWWNMREWWWKIGFTLRAIRCVRRNWLVSSLGAIRRATSGSWA